MIKDDVVAITLLQYPVRGFFQVFIDDVPSSPALKGSLTVAPLSPRSFRPSPHWSAEA